MDQSYIFYHAVFMPLAIAYSRSDRVKRKESEGPGKGIKKIKPKRNKIDF